MNILFFDTETTGMFHFKMSAGHPSQPHLVQLGALLHDENAKVRGEINVLIQPEGWEIPAEAQAIHGISTQDAMKYGVPLAEGLAMFNALADRADLIVAHNIAYDEAVMETQYLRDHQRNGLLCKPKICTMKASTDILKIPGPYGYKWPKLEEAHQHFMGYGLDGAHDAMVDVLGCSRVYYALRDLKADVPAEAL